MVRHYPPTPGFRPLALLLGTLIGLQALGNAYSEEPFPYVAYVVHADSYVRSGPGQRYYPTQQLPQGFATEVHRHDGDGWCAIRPPEGSISWVAAHEVRLVEPNVAEVITDRAVTRVGSALSPTRSAVQVLLKKGERVSVAPGNASDDPSWLRIIPPAGEFRWIAAKDLGRQAPLEVTPPASHNNVWSRSKSFEAPALTTAQTTAAAAPNAFNHLLQSTGQVSATNSMASMPTVTYDAGRVDIVAGSPADLQLAQFQGQSPESKPSVQEDTASARTPAESTSPRIRLGGLSGTATINQQEIPEWVKEIELRLSQMVAEPPSEWNFDQIRMEANSMLLQTESSPVRTQLRDLLDRIARFQKIRDGYGNVTQGTETTEEEFPVPTLGAPVDPMADLVNNVRERVREDFSKFENQTDTKTRSEALEKPLYDAVGLLKPVVSRRKNAPQYALVDSKGDVVSFITPTPDLNLNAYIGRRIGVNGTRGFMTEYRRAHVTAGRVTPVDATLRR